MTSVTSPLAFRRRCLLGMASLFVAFILAAGTFGFNRAVAAPVLSDCGMSDCGTQPAATDCQWISAPLTAEHSGEVPPCRLLAARPILAFGDAAWDEVTADQGTASIASTRRRQRATTALQLAPLRASLQLHKVRLQI